MERRNKREERGYGKLSVEMCLVTCVTGRLTRGWFYYNNLFSYSRGSGWWAGGKLYRPNHQRYPPVGLLQRLSVVHGV